MTLIDRLRFEWEWHVRVRLCCWGIVGCSGHRDGEVDATWLAIDWPTRWTR